MFLVICPSVRMSVRPAVVRYLTPFLRDGDIFVLNREISVKLHEYLACEWTLLKTF